MIGIIKRVMAPVHYGFLTGPMADGQEGTMDYFFHGRDVRFCVLGQLSEGQRVSFEPFIDDRSGRYQARSVRPSEENVVECFDGRQEGRLDFKHGRGYGFIVMDHMRYFVHASQFPSWDDAIEGEWFSFETDVSPEGRVQAVNLERVQ